MLDEISVTVQRRLIRNCETAPRLVVRVSTTVERCRGDAAGSPGILPRHATVLRPVAVLCWVILPGLETSADAKGWIYIAVQPLMLQYPVMSSRRDARAHGSPGIKLTAGDPSRRQNNFSCPAMLQSNSNTPIAPPPPAQASRSANRLRYIRPSSPHPPPGLFQRPLTPATRPLGPGRWAAQSAARRRPLAAQPAPRLACW